MSKISRKRIALDLFSGCGGLSQGLEDAGFKVLACCEIRPEARETYKLNHPGTILIDDICEAGPLELKKKLVLLAKHQQRAQPQLWLWVMLLLYAY